MNKNPKIIYEDIDTLVLDKPSGLVVHFDGKTKEPSVTDWLISKYPGIQDIGETQIMDDKEIHRPGIVHRIDRDTSGVLIVAKNQKSYIHLKQQFKESKAAKVYRAFLYGAPKDAEGIINLPIGRSNKDFRLRSAEKSARGKLREALTKYEVLEENGKFSYIEAHPKTGRTHQLRVHFKALHHPIVCDPLYAPKRECALGFERLALHAYSLTLTLPSGATLCAEAPIPKDFIDAIKALKI